MIPIPTISDADITFGNISHMPKYGTVPEKYKYHTNEHVKFITSWFFYGLSEKEYERLHPRDGVDKEKALRAITAILVSFTPKHEHKEAGCAYLLDEWFDINHKSESMLVKLKKVFK